MDKEKITSEIKKLLGWQLQENHHLYKQFKFPDFKSALRFVNQIAEVAEELNHHPNISFTWGKVEIAIWTHTVNTVSGKDFELARKIDGIGHG